MRRKLPSDANDPQRGAVYAWQDEVSQRWLDPVKLDVNECQALIKRVYKDHRLSGLWPLVAGTRDEVRASYNLLSHTIHLPHRWARDRYVVLHETAHSLLPAKVESHGPEFASLMFQLWSDYIPFFDPWTARALAEQMPQPVRFAFELGGGVPSPTIPNALPCLLLFLYACHERRKPLRDSDIAVLRPQGTRPRRNSRRHPYLEAQVELL